MSETLRPLVPPPGAPPRRTRHPLPRYAHVPGLTPHPVTHPQGHSYALEEPVVDPASLDLPHGWGTCDGYLHGIDLFNRACFWEAHEAWEAVWLAAGPRTTVGRYLQGLIQAAAALLKLHVAMPRGAANLLAKSRRNLAPAARRAQGRGKGRYMGIHLESWLQQLERHLEDPAAPFPFLDPRPLEPGS